MATASGAKAARSAMSDIEPLSQGACVTGVVLAGGRSSRMGCDKATLTWQGRSLLEHMRLLLLQVGADVVLSSGAGRGRDAIADQVAGAGPLGGIASVATHAADGWMLVVPVDMPRLTPGLLRELLRESIRSGRPALCYRGQPLPLCVRLDGHARATIAGLLAARSRGRSLRAMHRALHGECLPVEPGMVAAFSNCNTPRDWEALQA